jgi:hypothetical protein
MLALLYQATSSSYTALAKTTHNKKYLASKRVEENKELYKEIASDEASRT